MPKRSGSADAKPVLLAVNGHEYRLAFATRSIVGMEARTGKSFGELGHDLERASVTSVVELLRAALEREHDAVSDDDLYAVLDECGLEAVMSALNRALERDLGGGTTRPRTPSGTGTTS